MPDQPFDPIATRHSLLNRLKDWGDQASWQEFFDAYWQLIYNVAVKAGLSDAEVSDLSCRKPSLPWHERSETSKRTRRMARSARG